MRDSQRVVAVLLASMFVASVAFAGSITKRGTVTPAAQTVFRIDTPQDGDTVFGIVEVRGYVLDPRGVSEITLLVDDTPIHSADINQPRADVWRKYARFYGEGFPYDPGFSTSFLAKNYSSTNHTIAIRVKFSNSETAVLGARTVKIDNALNQAPIGALDSPRDPSVWGQTDYVSSVYPITGWALDDTKVRQRVSPTGCHIDIDYNCHVLADIEVMVDGKAMGGTSQVIYPLPRPDVANAHPDVAGAFKSGFQLNLDTTRHTNGGHTIAVRVWDDQGMNRIIGSRDIWIDNNYATLGPFGKIDFPMPNAHLFGMSCISSVVSGIPYDPYHNIWWISGWAIDQNDIQRYEGIKYVELLLDGVVLSRTSTDCFYFQPFSQNINCMGFERPDILYRYPELTAVAKDSGFFFAIDVDYLMKTMGIHMGLHYLAIRVGTQDPMRPAVVIDQIPVILECPTNQQDFPSWGELDKPEPMQLMKGNELVEGWVYDFSHVVTINFYIDGVLDGYLTGNDSNMHLVRNDVRHKYPWLFDALYNSAGFRYSLDTTKFVDGVHQLVVETIDSAGGRNYWVQRSVSFNNHNRP